MAPSVAGKEADSATRADGVPLTRQQVAQRVKQRLREEIRAKAMAAAQNRRGTAGIKEAVRDPAGGGCGPCCCAVAWVRAWVGLRLC